MCTRTFATNPYCGQKYNGVEAMLIVLTKGADENPFVYDHQNGGNDVTCLIAGYR